MGSPAVDAALRRLLGLHPRRIDLTLGRIRRLLTALGSPQEKLPPVLHVAGTNGKGSTVAFLGAMLAAAGYRVHAYTSPHLVRFNERIALAGAPIGDQALLALLERVERANAGAPITFFEITTAAALLAFAEVPADVVVLEVGLGGRFDATNVVANPVATAITRISFDHQAFLGDTIAAITGEKAGILKPGVAAAIGRQGFTDAEATIAAQAAAVGAPLMRCGREWRIESEPGSAWVWVTEDRAIRLPPPSLPGRHQIDNAGTAIAVLHTARQRLPVDDTAIAAGVGAVHWPGRLQRLDRHPLAAGLPAGWTLWLDGGHNDSAGEALAVWADGPGRGSSHEGAAPAGGEPVGASSRGETDSGPVWLIVGMQAQKDLSAFLRPFATLAQGTIAGVIGIATPAGIETTGSSHAAAGIAAAATALGLTGMPAASAADAVALIAGATEGSIPGRVLICGSLYLAGAVLSQSTPAGRNQE